MIGTVASLGIIGVAFAVGMITSVVADRRAPEPAHEVARRRPPRSPPSVGGGAPGAYQAPAPPLGR